jgi:hypothetical protein
VEGRVKSKLPRALVLGMLLLAAIAISLPGLIPPQNYKARNACINQLNCLDADVKEWAKQTGASNGTQVSLRVLEKWDPRLHPFVDPDGCPSGGTYTLIVGQPPKCSIGGPGHTYVAR